MIASLPMYDWPELQPANDRLWQLIAANLADAPAALTRSDDLWGQWLSPDLLLGQTCSLPFATRLKGRVALVGTLDLGLPKCPAGHYNSVIVAHKDADLPTEPLTTRIAINEDSSQSGWGALWQEARRRDATLGPVTATGAHRASVGAVAAGLADIAIVDANSWRLAKCFDAHTNALEVIGHTPPTPSLPLITAKTNRVGELRAAITAAIPRLSADDRSVLGVRSLTMMADATYFAVPIPLAPALAPALAHMT